MDARTIRIDDASLHVGVHGTGPDVLVLTGGPGCVQYLEQEGLSPTGLRCWYPEQRGVGRSTGTADSMEQAVLDLEAVRLAVGVPHWLVVGHSWGSDLAVRYAVEHPRSVSAVIGIAGRGFQRDRSWSAHYEAGRPTEPVVDISCVPEVHSALSSSFGEWIHRPDLWRRLADCVVPMRFLAAELDIRPSWPLQQLAALVPHGSFACVPGVGHDFWATDPDVWVRTVGEACARSGTDAADAPPPTADAERAPESSG